MADFEGRDPEFGQSGSDDWGSFKDDWSTPVSDTGADEFAPDQQEPVAQQGGFIPPDDDGWGSTSGMPEQNFQTMPEDFASSEVPQQEFQPRQTHFSMKTVAFIILGIGIVAALIFLGLDKIHFSKKDPVQNNPPPQQTQQEQQGNQQGNQQGGDVQTTPSNPDIGQVVLVEIPETMQLDYNGDVMEVNGKVIAKQRYVQGHQVLYCVQVGVAFGSSSETINYYCNYSSFSAVKEQDIVVLKYQQVDDSYISVISISK